MERLKNLEDQENMNVNKKTLKIYISLNTINYKKVFKKIFLIYINDRYYKYIFFENVQNFRNKH